MATIHLLSPSGKQERRIKAPGVDTEPAISPNGKEIAFHSYDHMKHTGGIYLMDVDGSQLRPLTNNPHDESPAFSPSGKRDPLRENTRRVTLLFGYDRL